MWRRSTGWGSGFESSRSSPQNGPPRFPHLFWKVRENEKESMTETRMKSRLFTSRLGEKIIFGMETQTCGEQFAHRRFFYSEVFVPALVAGIFFVNASQKRPPSGAAQLPACRWLDSTETRNVPPTAWNEKNGGVLDKNRQDIPVRCGKLGKELERFSCGPIRLCGRSCLCESARGSFALRQAG